MKFIKVDYHDNVTMTCPILFHECASKLANGQFEKQIDENDKGKSRPKGGRAAKLKRLLKLWSLFDRNIVNLAAKEDNTVTTNSDETADALVASWANTFTN